MGDIEEVTFHKNDEEYAARQLRWLTSGSLADDIVECYREYGVEIKINDKKQQCRVMVLSLRLN